MPRTIASTNNVGQLCMPSATVLTVWQAQPLSDIGPFLYRPEAYVGTIRHVVIVAVDLAAILFAALPPGVIPAVAESLSIRSACLRREEDVNPLIVGLTKKQGTNVPYLPITAANQSSSKSSPNALAALQRKH